MKESDFIEYKIDNFTPSEIVETGANVEDISVDLMVAIQKFRLLVNRRVVLLSNGMTTGKHTSKLHPGGKAIDSYLHPDDGEVKIIDVFKYALEAGFKGIGIYWNGTLHSFHFDLRNSYSFWSGKKETGKEWDFYKLIKDPKDL